MPTQISEVVIMRKVLVLSLAAVLLVALGQPGPARASAAADDGAHHRRGVPAFQTAQNRQIKTVRFRYKRLCPSCSDDVWYTDPNFGKPAKGRVKVDIGTYKIKDQNDRYDFYMLNVSADLKRRRGDEDWGWMDITLRSVGKVKVASSSYSLGKSAVNEESCKSYPIQLGVQFFFVAAGTEVGSVTFCHKGSQVSSSPAPRGRLYHSTGLSGISSIQMMRFVRVKDGSHPRFRVSMARNHEGVNCANVVDGYHCWIIRAFSGPTVRIGTTRQR